MPLHLMHHCCLQNRAFTERQATAEKAYCLRLCRAQSGHEKTLLPPSFGSMNQPSVRLSQAHHSHTSSGTARMRGAWPHLQPCDGFKICVCRGNGGWLALPAGNHQSTSSQQIQDVVFELQRGKLEAEPYSYVSRAILCVRLTMEEGS